MSPELLEIIRRSVAVGSTVSTVATGMPNRIVGIQPNGVLIETDRSKRRGEPPKLVPAWMFNTAWEYLQIHRRLTQQELVSTDGLNVKRSAAVMAILARLPGVEVATRRPSELHWYGKPTDSKDEPAG